MNAKERILLSRKLANPVAGKVTYINDVPQIPAGWRELTTGEVVKAGDYFTSTSRIYRPAYWRLRESEVGFIYNVTCDMRYNSHLTKSHITIRRII